MSHAPEKWLTPLDMKADSSLSRQGMHGMFWLTLSQFLRLFIILLATMALVRILPPSDFGLIAMTATVTSFLVLFRDAGLTQATIQQTHLTHHQVSTIFWTNQGIAFVLGLATFGVSYPLGSFYGESQLVPAIQLLALGFIAGAAGSQHDALLRRALHYRTVAFIEVGSVFFSYVPTIIAALAGWGFWALVLQRLLQLAWFSAGCWIKCGWRPGFHWKWKETAGQVTFGAQISLFNFLNYFSRNGDNILIGWRLGAHALGIYAKSYDLLLAPLQQLAAPISNTLLPILARLREQPEAYLKTYKDSYGLAALVMFPISTMMVIYTESLVTVVFGDGWEEAIPVIRWLGLAVATQIVASGTGTLLISQQRGKDFAIVGAIGAVITVSSFIVGLPYGIAGVAGAYAVASTVLLQPFNFWWVGRQGPVSFLDSYKLLALPAWCAATTWPVLWLTKAWLPAMPLLTLLLGGVLCVITMLSALLVLPQGRHIIKRVISGLLSGSLFKKTP